MKKFFAKIHLWLSIPFGIIIAIVCLTGAILVFETEILEFAILPAILSKSKKQTTFAGGAHGQPPTSNFPTPSK